VFEMVQTAQYYPSLMSVLAYSHRFMPSTGYLRENATLVLAAFLT
jgi:hypothetical protein